MTNRLHYLVVISSIYSTFHRQIWWLDAHYIYLVWFVPSLLSSFYPYFSQSFPSRFIIVLFCHRSNKHPTHTILYDRHGYRDNISTYCSLNSIDPITFHFHRSWRNPYDQRTQPSSSSWHSNMQRKCLRQLFPPIRPVCAHRLQSYRLLGMVSCGLQPRWVFLGHYVQYVHLQFSQYDQL